MQRLPSKGKSARPAAAPASKSFTRFEPSESPTAVRSRSSSLQQVQPQILEDPLVDDPLSPAKEEQPDIDVFERSNNEANAAESGDGEGPVSFSDGYEELPIEIQSLMERFLESLALRARPSPPLSMDRLSELYQDFYEHVQGQINTHIATLATRLSRDQSPSPSVSSGRSMASRGGRKNSRPLERTQSTDPLAAEHQMLTATEITDKRKARRQLEVKRLAMEEAVERGVCEKVYPRIWRHTSTDDEARDEKLRSRAAALSLVGVDLKELISSALRENVAVPADLNPSEEDDASSPRNLLSNARKSLENMNAERYPLGKLEHLTAVHKHIVEALQQLFPSTSSADEVLPTLIYTIITSPPESNCVISNFNFIQRFRMATKIDGETAYCLTNLEAAITFLETVDLSSLRPGEGNHSAVKPSSRPGTPRSESSDPLYRGLPGDTSSPLPQVEAVKAAPSPARSRSISTLVHSGPRTLEAAGDVVMHGADTAIDGIHSALDGGFKFLFGRMREKQASSPHSSPNIAAPKTLEDARKLVSPTDPPVGEDDISVGESAMADNGGETATDEPSKKPEDKILGMIGGRRYSNQSTDSNRSAPGASVAAAKKAATVQTKAAPSVATSGQQVGGYAGLESMRSLGNSLNPLKGFSGIGMMRGFGRSGTNTPSSAHAATQSLAAGAAQANDGAISPLSQAPEQQHQPSSGDEKATSGFSWESVAPPIQRFVELREPKELNFYDVELLLRDYQRLAGALSASRAAPQ